MKRLVEVLPIVGATAEVADQDILDSKRNAVRKRGLNRRSTE
jgi:hypothetical protein